MLAWALAGALLAPALHAGVVRADSSSNIPGIPLPGSTVTGSLGGAIYDVVYRVVVPAGNVLLASMTGTAGTDFDLYVFDATAVDIYANPPVGLIGKSTGPTSTESVSIQSVSGGTYYIDLAGFGRTLGQYQLTVRVAADTTAPKVGLVLDGGAPATNDPVVTVTVVAEDDLSGVDAMQLSEDGVRWTDWSPYSVIVLWTFPSGDGTKSFYARVRDRAGNVSSVAKGQIELDTVAPSILGVSPPAGAPTNGLQPTFSIRFSEPIRESTWLAGALRVSDPYGTRIFGSYSYDKATSTGSFVPGMPLVPGQAYTVALGDVTDLAGNPLPAVPAWANTALASTDVTLTASPGLVARGGAVTLDGRVGSIAGAAVTLERAIGGGPFAAEVPLLTATGGAFRTIETILQNTSFRAVYAGSDTVGGATSPTVRVLVRRGVALASRTAGSTLIVARAHRVSMKAVLTPSGPDIVVSFRIYRTDTRTGRLVLQSTVPRTTVHGYAYLAWTPTLAGRYVIRVTTPPTPLYANGISPAYAWLVR